MKKLTKNQKIIISVAVVGVVGTAIWLGWKIIKNKGKTPEQIAEEKEQKKLAKEKKKADKKAVKEGTSTGTNTSTSTNTNTNTNTNTSTTNTSSSTPSTSTGSSNPFGALPNGASSCERTVQNHDRSWNYVKCSGTWYTQRKGSSGWKSLAGNTVAINRLEAYSGS
jgi:cytoskeletal protein RodZ